VQLGVKTGLARVGVAGVGLTVGVLAAIVDPARHGGGHSCPAGAMISACTYPPNLLHQRVEWGLLGLTAGALVAFLAWLIMLPRTKDDGT
jgi:hypothetical protein